MLCEKKGLVKTVKYNSEDLRDFLASRIRSFSLLEPEDQEEILAMAQALKEKGHPPSFILSGIRSTIRLLLQMKEEVEPPVPEEVKSLLGSSILPPYERVTPRQQPRKESKAREKEGLQQYLWNLIKEAKSAKHPHERKKLRRDLLALDRGHIRRVLGREGQEICSQINLLLNQLKE